MSRSEFQRVSPPFSTRLADLCGLFVGAWLCRWQGLHRYGKDKAWQALRCINYTTRKQWLGAYQVMLPFPLPI
jgi:hypothetical protein